jgi:hypothetical protein
MTRGARRLFTLGAWLRDKRAFCAQSARSFRTGVPSNWTGACTPCCVRPCSATYYV